MSPARDHAVFVFSVGRLCALIATVALSNAIVVSSVFAMFFWYFDAKLVVTW